MKIKTMNRLFAGLLCFAMLFSGVLIPGTLVVARAEGSSGEGTSLPVLKSLVWEETFDDITLNGKWSKSSEWPSTISGSSSSGLYNYTNGSGSVDLDKKVFCIARNNTTEGKLYQNIFFGTDKECYSGSYGLAFTLTRNNASKNQEVNFKIVGSKDLVSASWSENGEITFTVYDDSERTTKGSYSTSTLTEGATIQFNYWIDTAESKISIWVNKEHVVGSKYTLVDASDGVKNIQFAVSKGADGDWLEIDDISFYEAFEKVPSVTITSANSTDSTAYDTLEEALTNAVTGDTIKLYDDATKTDGTLTVGSGVTLDLAGNMLDLGTDCYLQASYTGANVIDSVGGGLLKVTDGKLVVQSDNSYMLIYDNENKGYRLSSVTMEEYAGTVDETSMSYLTRPNFGTDSVVALIAKGNESSKVKVGVRLSWTYEGTAGSKDCYFSDTLLQAMYGDATNPKGVKFTITGLEAFENVTATTIVWSGLGVTELGTARVHSVTNTNENE